MLLLNELAIYGSFDHLQLATFCIQSSTPSRRGSRHTARMTGEESKIVVYGSNHCIGEHTCPKNRAILTRSGHLWVVRDRSSTRGRPLRCRRSAQFLQGRSPYAGNCELTTPQDACFVVLADDHSKDQSFHARSSEMQSRGLPR